MLQERVTTLAVVTTEPAFKFYSMTPEEKLNITIKKIVKSVITSQLALDYNEDIKHTPYYKHELKKALNGALVELRKTEKSHYNEFLKTLPDTDTIYHLFNQQFDMIEQLSKIDVPQYTDVKNIIKAYLINPKSIMGITNKVNKSI